MVEVAEATVTVQAMAMEMEMEGAAIPEDPAAECVEN